MGRIRYLLATATPAACYCCLYAVFWQLQKRAAHLLIGIDAAFVTFAKLSSIFQSCGLPLTHTGTYKHTNTVTTLWFLCVYGYVCECLLCLCI